MQLLRTTTQLKHRHGTTLVRAASLAIVLSVAFLVGCETTKKDRADAHSIIRERDSGGETHGEVRAMYGVSTH